MLRTLTDQKLETIFLLSVPLLIGDTGAIFAASENILLARLIFIESKKFRNKIDSQFHKF